MHFYTLNLIIVQDLRPGNIHNQLTTTVVTRQPPTDKEYAFNIRYHVVIGSYTYKIEMSGNLPFKVVLSRSSPSNVVVQRAVMSSMMKPNAAR